MTSLADPATVSILLVEASPVFINLISRFLQKYDQYKIVETACYSEQALALAVQTYPQIILLDLAIPGKLTGLETIIRLREALPEAAIVVLALLDAESYREIVLSAGASEFISKSELYKELLPAIKRVVASQPGRAHP